MSQAEVSRLDSKLEQWRACQLSIGPASHRSGFNAQDATVACRVSVSALPRAPGPELRPALASSRLALLGQWEPQQSSRAQPGSRCPSSRPGRIQRRLVRFHVSPGAICGRGGDSHLSDSDLRAPTHCPRKVGAVLATQRPLASRLVVALSPEKLDHRNRMQHARVCERQLELSRFRSLAV